MIKRFTLASATIVLSSLMLLLNGCAGGGDKPAAEKSPPENSPTVASSPPSSRTVESSPTSEKTPTVESSPSAETTPTAESSPTSETTPTAESSPTSETSPTAESSPSNETASGEFQIENAVLAKENSETGQLQPVETPVFKKGDQVSLVLLNVGKFQKGEDGKNQVDLDVELQDASGNVLASKQGLLGERGKLELPEGVAKSPVGFVDAETTSKLEPGEYSIAITVHDKVAGTSAKQSKTFTLQ